MLGRRTRAVSLCALPFASGIGLVPKHLFAAQWVPSTLGDVLPPEEPLPWGAGCRTGCASHGYLWPRPAVVLGTLTNYFGFFSFWVESRAAQQHCLCGPVLKQRAGRLGMAGPCSCCGCAPWILMPPVPELSHVTPTWSQEKTESDGILLFPQGSWGCLSSHQGPQQPQMTSPGRQCGCGRAVR